MKKRIAAWVLTVLLCLMCVGCSPDGGEEDAARSPLDGITDFIAIFRRYGEKPGAGNNEVITPE